MITLYKITVPYSKVDKSSSLTAPVADINPINPYNSISVDSPNYTIKYKPEYMTCNYLYDDVFKRYYFINDRTPEPGGRISISCNCDLLMTFKNAIYNARGTVLRNEHIGITDVIDSQLPINPNDCYMVGTLFPNQPFPETTAFTEVYPVDTNQYIMVVRN